MNFKAGASIVILATLLALVLVPETAEAQRYRDYDGPGGGCLSSREINARLRSEGWHRLALVDQRRGGRVLIMRAMQNGRGYLLFVNGCTGAVVDTRQQ